MPISFPKSDQVPAENCLFLYQQCAIECNHIAKPSQVNIFPNRIAKPSQVNINNEVAADNLFPSSTVCNRVQPHSKTQARQYLSQGPLRKKPNVVFHDG